MTDIKVHCHLLWSCNFCSIAGKFQYYHNCINTLHHNFTFVLEQELASWAMNIDKFNPESGKALFTVKCNLEPNAFSAFNFLHAISELLMPKRLELTSSIKQIYYMSWNHIAYAIMLSQVLHFYIFTYIKNNTIQCNQIPYRMWIMGDYLPNYIELYYFDSMVAFELNDVYWVNRLPRIFV